MSRSLAVIPAKGQSVRIPHKNMVMLGGKPLVQWTFDAVKGLFDEVVVSTNDPEILLMAKRYNYKLALHPDGDVGATNVVLDVLEGKSYKNHYDNVWMLQPTSPFRSAKNIKAALYEYKSVKDTTDLTLISVVEGNKRCSYVDIGTTFTKRPFISPQFLEEPDKSPNSYRVNGAIFGTTIENLLKKRAFVKDVWSLPFLMDSIESIEIDSPADLALAITVAKGLK